MWYLTPLVKAYCVYCLTLLEKGEFALEGYIRAFSVSCPLLNHRRHKPDFTVV